MRTPVAPRFPAVVLLAALALGGGGCAYRWGSVMHPQIRSLAVGSFDNETRDAAATALLRDSLSEAISTQAGLMLAQPAAADAIVEGRILNLRQEPLARAKVRDERTARDDSDEYQTVLYRLQASVEFRVRIPGREQPFIETRRVTGQADLGNWPDQNVFQADALDRALDDAARQIVAIVTEAW
ncbi:MAG: hypothetical protein JXR77_05115 [Lentisphaeria bacterium]|nr:hypothetical protein [Lentisphaeria bacterium]